MEVKAVERPFVMFSSALAFCEKTKLDPVKDGDMYLLKLL